MVDDGVDRTPIPAFELALPVKRMHQLTMPGFHSGVATLSVDDEIVAELTSGHGMGGMNMYVHLEDGGIYELRLNEIIKELVRQCLEHNENYDLEAEKARTEEQRQAHREAKAET